MMKQNNLYWCDHCSITTLDSEGVEGVEYYGCYSQQAYAKHIKTPKHLKSKSLIVDGVTCDECNKTFTVEGYATHKERNKSLWECHKTKEIANMTCNNFCLGKKRYESVNGYKASLNQPKKRRTPVGKFSPITKTIRPPNGYAKQKQKELIRCGECNGALFTSQYDFKFLKLHNTFICLCDETVKLKQETKIEKDATDADDAAAAAADAAADADGVDITERPQFEESCDTCCLPINYHVPIKIINKWDIDTCECEDD